MKKLLEENDTLMQTTPTTHPPAWVSPIYKPNFLSKNPANDVNVHLEIYNNVFRMIPGHKKNTCPIEKWFWMPNAEHVDILSCFYPSMGKTSKPEMLTSSIPITIFLSSKC